MSPLDLKPGDVVTTRGGAKLQFVAIVPQARLDSQAVFVSMETGTIEAYWIDGCYMPDRGYSTLDIVAGS